MALRKLLTFLSFFLLCTNIYPHSGWQAHANDMMDVFGFIENPKLREWMKFISSEIIDKPGDFYSRLKSQNVGFSCKHRLLFHWGYDAEPWNEDLEQRVRDYCDIQDLNVESIIKIFKSDLRNEQKRRNKLINQKTEDLFGFAHGGKDAKYAHFFCSMAYDVHLIGDYTSDNTDLNGLQDIDKIISSIKKSILDLDPIKGKFVIKKIELVNKQYFDVQKKADALMLFLKKEIPRFIKCAQEGSIRRRLESRGFKLKED